MTVERDDQLDGFEAYVLLSARNCIERVGWTQGARARDRYGDPVLPMAYEADAYSLRGALDVGFGIHRPTILYPHRKLLADKKAELLRRVKELSADDMEAWNDAKGRQAAHVVDLLVQVAATYGEDQR